MKRCWLHIGMHKTGTTSLQASLASVDDPVGWNYIRIDGRRNLGSALYAMFSSKPHRYHWFQKRGDTPEQVAKAGAKLRKKFIEAIEACTEENFIISGESLSLIDPRGIAALHKFLKPLCDEIRVIGYVRPPIGFKISFFQQRVKHSNCTFDFSDFRLNYYRRFKKFDNVFGVENVILRKFEPALFKNQCVVEDLCEQIGIPAPESVSVIRVNESLCREACGILYAYRKFGPDYGVGLDVIKESKHILAPLFAMKGTKFKVSRAVVNSSLELEDKDVRWMEQRLGASLREDLPDDGTEVADEADLLRIEHSSCVEFAARFREIHGIELPDELIPVGSSVDPRRVAEFVEYGQALCRTRIQERRALKPRPLPKKPVSKKPRAKPLRILRRCWKWLKTRALSNRGS